MDGFTAYKYYLALKLHFTTEKYDVFEYDGRVSARRDSFMKRNDKSLFERIAIKKNNPRDLIDFYVANFANYNLTMLYDQSEAEKFHKKWMKNKESMSYNFTRDCLMIERLSKSNPFDSTDGAPQLMNMYLSDQLSVESMSILNDFDGYIDRWTNISFLWSTQFRTIKKLSRFVKYDSSKLQPTYFNLKENLKELDHGTHIS
jgi:hypothetical protein